MVLPGVTIFSGVVRGVHRRASCLTVLGRVESGRLTTLFEHDCPPVGFRWGTHPYDALFQRLMRNIDMGLLLRKPGDPPPSLSYSLPWAHGRAPRAC